MITLNTERFKIKLLWGFLFSSLFGASQTVTRIGTLPTLNVNGKINSVWSINAKAEARFLLYETHINTNSIQPPVFELADFSFIGARKVGLDNRIGIGYLLRTRENEFQHRIIEQYTILQRLSGVRLAHRFSSDQTFIEHEPFEFRLRYRIATEIPFNGKSVDPKEFYGKLNNEYLGRWKKSDFDAEIRLVPVIGYTSGQNSKFEAGIDYRASSLFTPSKRSTFWLSLNWFYQIDFTE